MMLRLLGRGERGERGERGAIAVVTALMMVVFLAVAALGVDITTQVNQRQKLHDTIDAAAHAGAYDLPVSGVLAKSDAVANALLNDPSAPTPTLTSSVWWLQCPGPWTRCRSPRPATQRPRSRLAPTQVPSATRRSVPFRATLYSAIRATRSGCPVPSPFPSPSPR